MQVATNRYYKDDQKGFRFQDKSGIFADSAFLNRIEQKLILQVIGNRSVTCWLGGVVTDSKNTPYYVFGHNQMLAQERGSNRLSCRFTFAVIPFEDLYKLGSASALIDALSEAESSQNFKPTIWNIREGSLSALSNDLDRVLTDALAAYVVDEHVNFELHESRSNCSEALSLIWVKSLFSRKMPVVALVDEPTVDMPQSGWLLYTRSGGEVKGGVLNTAHLAPEQEYLYFAYRYVVTNWVDDFRRVFTPGELERVSREIGSSNQKLLEPLLLWYYAIQNRMNLLPTEQEKAAMLRQIH